MMIKLISAAVTAATLIGVTALPAAAQNMSRQGAFVQQQCDRNPGMRGCNDWHRNGRNWHRDDYDEWYRWNQPYLGGIAAGLFGLALGAAAGSASQPQPGSAYDDHVARCEARYRSYSAETDTYLGFDGAYHRCNL